MGQDCSILGLNQRSKKARSGSIFVEKILCSGILEVLEKLRKVPLRIKIHGIQILRVITFLKFFI